MHGDADRDAALGEKRRLHSQQPEPVAVSAGLWKLGDKGKKVVEGAGVVAGEIIEVATVLGDGEGNRVAVDVVDLVAVGAGGGVADLGGERVEVA